MHLSKSNPTCVATVALPPLLQVVQKLWHTLSKYFCPEKIFCSSQTVCLLWTFFARRASEKVLLAADLTPHDGGGDEDDGGDEDEHDSVAEERDDGGVNEKKVAEEISTRKVRLSLACVHVTACLLHPLCFWYIYTRYLLVFGPCESVMNKLRACFRGLVSSCGPAVGWSC